MRVRKTWFGRGMLRAAFLGILLSFVPVVADAQKPELVVQTGHSDHVTSVAFSRDGRLVLSGSADAVRLWETGTGKEVRRFEGQSGRVYSVAFSPDGRFVLTGSGDAIARVWETATGKEVRRFKGHLGRVYCVAVFSPDGRFVLTGGDDQNARLWEMATSKEVRRFGAHPNGVNFVAFSPDGRFVLTGSAGAPPRLWETATGKEVRRFKGDSDMVACSPDGRFVLTVDSAAPTAEKLLARMLNVAGPSDGGSAGDVARLWETATGKEVRRFERHSYGVTSVALSPDGRLVLVGTTNNTACLWETSTGKELRCFKGHTYGVGSVAFSADGRFVLTGSDDRTARLWETFTGKEVRRFQGHSRGVISDGRFVLTVGADRTARLWEMFTGTEGRRFGGRLERGSRAAISPDGQFVFTGSEDGNGRLWDTATGKEVRRFKGQLKSVFLAAFSPDGRFLLTESEVDSTAGLWETATGKKLRRFEGSGSVTSGAFSPDGRFVLVDSRLWETATGKEVRRFEGDPFAVAFSPDGRFVLIGESNHAARLWETDTGKEIRRFGAHRAPGAIGRGPSAFDWSKLRTTVTVDRTGSSYDPETVRAVAFSPDGRFVLTGSEDRTARLWETGTGKELRRFEGHSDMVTSVALSADGRFVFTASRDMTARLWESSTGRELCTLVGFTNGTWVVVDSEGRFDTDNLDEIEGLHWVMPDDPLRALPLEIFMRDYYHPGLLARILKGEKLAQVRSLTELNRVQPQVTITAIEPSAGDPTIVSISIKVAGDQRTFRRTGENVVMRTGVSDVRLFRDGQLVGYQDGEIKLVDNKANLKFAGIRLPTARDKKEVEFSAYAFNADRVKSATARRRYAMPSALKPMKGRAYVISVGVNDSEDPAYRLNYAANDAQEIQKTVDERLKETGEFAEVIPITLVSRPTKRNVQTILDLLAGRSVSDDVKQVVPNAEKIMPARPDDMVLISFSCHGDSDRAGNFYLLPYDIGSADTHRKIEDIYPKCISSEELSQWLRDVDAGEMVMIIDACHSAAAVESADFKPGPMGSRGLGQLAYDKGMRILAASQADSVALESADLGHGLLTYALLKEGLELGQADFAAKDDKILLSEWLAYGVDRLPKLYAEKLGPRGVLLTAASQGPPALVQQPSLFDFTKQKRDLILAKPESPKK